MATPRRPVRATPYCNPECANWPKVDSSKYTETGDIRDQWTCPLCGRPAKSIFDNTNRWAADRAAYYGGAGDVSDHSGEPVGAATGHLPERLGDGADATPAGEAGGDLQREDRPRDVPRIGPGARDPLIPILVSVLM